MAETENVAAATQTKNDSVAEQESALKAKFPYLTGYVYMSDPDSTEPTWRHKVIPIFEGESTDNLPWHIYKERPDNTLVDPVWDTKLNNGLGGWKENNAETQSQILATAQVKIAELDKEKGQLDQQIKAVKDTQEISAQQSLALTKSLKQMSDSQENTTKVLASMQNIMLSLKTAIDAKNTATQPVAPVTEPVAPTKPVEPTQPTQATTADK